MKKWIAFVLCAATVLLCGCVGFSADEMLSAPALTKDQSAVLAALEDTGEKVRFVYPSAGEDRTPVRFLDMDGDGQNEAAVFYATDADPAANFAVMEKDEDGRWQIVSAVTGGGTDIDTLHVVRVKDSGLRVLVVEWSSVASEQNTLCAYRYGENEIALGYTDVCAELLVYDVDKDSFFELCYVAANNVFDPYSLRCVDVSQEGFFLVGEVQLTASLMRINSFSAGRLSDGSSAIVVDEDLGNDAQLTELFAVKEGSFSKLTLAEGKSLDRFTLRGAAYPTARAIDSSGRVYLPGTVPPFDGIADPDVWTYWYGYNAGVMEYRAATYIESGYKFALTVPDSWLLSATVARSEQEARLIEVYDTQNKTMLLQLKILNFGEQTLPYIEQGYTLLTQSGAYRYYIKANCSREDLAFISEQFLIL